MWLNDQLADLKAELSSLPEGSLYVYQKSGKNYYCQRLPKRGNRKKERRNAITKDSETVLALVRKKYVERAIENIKSDIENIDRAITAYSPVGEDIVMKPFCAKYPELTGGIYYGGRDPDAWTAGYIQPEFHPENLKSISARGEKMRSGGEMYISSRLDHFGIVNDYSYILSNIEKVKDYIGYGIKPWDNFIMTFSNEQGGYDGKLIDALIECWLL